MQTTNFGKGRSAKMDYKQAIQDWMKTHADELIHDLQLFVREGSIQGNEKGVQQLVANALTKIGLAIDVWEPSGEALLNHPYFCSPRTAFVESPNVVGVWKGTGGGKSIILNGHVDVVPVGDYSQWDDDPFSGKLVDNKIYGRGTTDMKGGNVALLYAIKCLRSLQVRLKGDVIFESVVEEESGGAGTLDTILRGYKADAAIIPEPTGMKVFPKQQGSMWFHIKIRGRSAHGGTRYEGVSAIDKSMLVIQAIAQLEKTRNQRIRDPLFENIPIPIPINIGKMKGGEWPSSVPDLIELEGRFGVAPDEDLEHAKQELQTCLHGIDDDWLRENPPEVEWFGAQWLPGRISMEHDFMHCFLESYEQVMNQAAVVEASPWGTDGGLLSKLGDTPTIVFGPGVTSVAHYPNEYIEIDRIIECAVIIAVTMIQWCGIEQSETRN
jgi:acetylornithine deacetylase